MPQASLGGTAPSVPAVFFDKLHRAYVPRHFDNWVVWAGNLSIEIEGVRYQSTLARAYLGPRRRQVKARARVELFVAAVDAAAVRPGDIDARLWTDANRREPAAAGPGVHLPMHLLCGRDGRPRLEGNNLVFESEPFALEVTGVFNYTAEFSADALQHSDPGKRWLPINDIGPNRDGVIVVSPQWVADAPSIVEVCPRKVGASLEDGSFRSGTLEAVTRDMPAIRADVVYLLPFFQPGFDDLHTGEDVRKGKLGSVYAVADFFRLDPSIVEDPDGANWAVLLDDDLLRPQDLDDLLEGELRSLVPSLGDLAAGAHADLPATVRTELVGRAQLRRLTREAHRRGKRVIFDLVLMQTSRDNPLIARHPEWYVQDEHGRPSIHRIAWLVYSDVALFDLAFNAPLQEYLLDVAPYWIERCDLDGVRIDASQTVDRPFLKRIKNRINAVRPDALVLGETLCPLDEALDIPVDMVYALMVDFHRDVEHAGSLINFLEEMHARFAPGTVALAYFENHDSPRATQVWRGKYAERLAFDPEAAAHWRTVKSETPVKTEDQPLLMALLKNLQASLIDASAGAAGGSNLTYGLEWGSDWGEENRTDFENPALLHPEQRRESLRARLVNAYAELDACVRQWNEARDGRVYYQRNEFEGGDPDDRVLAYVRYTDAGALLALHNLDSVHPRRVRYAFEYLPQPAAPALLFDTYPCMGLESSPAPAANGEETVFSLAPLQSRIYRLY